MNLGGWHDPKGVAAALVHALGGTCVTVAGGGTLSVSTLAVVLDGQGVTLPASPADDSVIVVVNAVPAVMLVVSAGVGNTVAGAATLGIGGNARSLTYHTGSTNWTL